MLRFFIEKLQLPPNAAKPSPICSSLWRQCYGRTICSQVESPSPPPFPDPDPEKRQTISYLVASCGLSSDAALSAAKVVRSKTKEKPISVIRLLKSYSFSDAQIDSVAIQRAHLLVANPEKNLKPKLDFLLSEGFSKKEVADILTANQTLLGRNLERGLISSYRFLSAALPSRSDVISALKCGNHCLTIDKEPGIKMLRDNGVSEPVILYLLKRFPMALMRDTEHLGESIKKLIDMGMDPKGKMFALTLSALCYLSKAAWLRKVKLYQELGWSESETTDMFKRYPFVFCLSDERLRSRVDFFKKSMGWDLAFISRSAALLQFSLEKRIIPRTSVLKVLMSKGLIKNKWSQSQFYIADRLFLEKYVNKYVAEVPIIIKMYQDAVALEVK